MNAVQVPYQVPSLQHKRFTILMHTGHREKAGTYHDWKPKRKSW